MEAAIGVVEPMHDNDGLGPRPLHIESPLTFRAKIGMEQPMRTPKQWHNSASSRTSRSGLWRRHREPHMPAIAWLSVGCGTIQMVPLLGRR